MESTRLPVSCVFSYTSAACLHSRDRTTETGKFSVSRNFRKEIFTSEKNFCWKTEKSALFSNFEIKLLIVLIVPMPTNQPAAAERADRCGSAEGAGRPDQDDRLQGECDPLHSTPPGSASREAGAALRMRTRVAKATPARTNSIRIQSDLESNFLVSVRNFEPYFTVHPLNARLLLTKETFL